MSDNEVLEASATEYRALVALTWMVGGALLEAAEKLPAATLPAPPAALDLQTGLLLGTLPSEEAAATLLAYLARAIYGTIPRTLTPSLDGVSAIVMAWNLDRRSMNDLKALWLKAADLIRDDLEILAGILDGIRNAIELDQAFQSGKPETETEGESDDPVHE